MKPLMALFSSRPEGACSATVFRTYTHDRLDELLDDPAAPIEPSASSDLGLLYFESLRELAVPVPQSLPSQTEGRVVPVY